MNFKKNIDALYEPLLISLLLSTGGVVSVIIAGYLNGVTISLNQGIGMNIQGMKTNIQEMKTNKQVMERIITLWKEKIRC